jgi:hypothetical protein
MGRPIKKRYFGNLNTPPVGGEDVASISVAIPGTGYANTATLTFSNPQLAGGVTATASITVAGGAITNVALISGGGGYTSIPTVSISGPGANATFNIALTTTANALAFTAFVSGGAARTLGDIVKQESTRRYLVRTSDGVGQCKLVTTSTLTAGTMNIVATDLNGSTYYVNKLTARKVVLVQSTASGSFLFGQNAVAGWTISGASAGIVSLASI